MKLSRIQLLLVSVIVLAVITFAFGYTTRTIFLTKIAELTDNQRKEVQDHTIDKIEAKLDSYRKMAQNLSQSVGIKDIVDYREYGLMDDFNFGMKKLESEYNLLLAPPIQKLDVREGKCDQPESFNQSLYEFCHTLSKDLRLILKVDFDSLLESTGASLPASPSVDSVALKEGVSILIDQASIFEDKVKNAISTQIVASLLVWFCLTILSLLLIWKRFFDSSEIIYELITNLGNEDQDYVPRRSDQLTQPIIDLAKDIKARLAESKELRVKSAIAQTTQMLAHDVRKPFSMLQGVISVISNATSIEAVESITKQAVPEINRAINSVNGMIQDIMEVGSEGNFMTEVVNPETILETSITDTFRYLDKADINLSYVINNNHRLNVDVLKVSRVFANIIANGVQAMGNKGEMWFHLDTAKEGFTKFTIGNSGSYIPPEKLDLLFDAFFTSDKKGGTGLGLAIAKKVVEGHGGEIWCTSSREKGTEFHFTLPSLPLPSSYRSVMPRTSIAIREQFKIEVGDKLTEEDAPQNEALFEQAIIDAQADDPHPISVLIVDDESLYITVLQNQITSNPDLSQHIEITTASSGEEAIQHVNDRSFDIIIQDVDMGGHGRDGFDTVKAVRELGAKATICIHSNRGGPQYHKQAIDSGADMFIGKTMPREQLLRMIYSTLGNPDDLLAEPKSASTAVNREGGLVLVESVRNSKTGV